MKNIVLLLFAVSQISSSQITPEIKLDLTPSSKVSFDDFKALVNQVEAHRAQRLINLNDFLVMSKQENVIILDTRSDSRYNRKHIKGAIHLNFSDFTQEYLKQIIPDTNTRILIYCNNNFDGDEINFASKIFIPKPTKEDKTRSLTLALNIPTYINLYGYGYKNVYELNELISFTDRRITYKGTTIINTK